MQAVRVVEELVSVGGRELALLRPADSETLLDEEAFAREEFLPYWAEPWPSSLALAGAVLARPLAGRRVLELGCGLALPSFAAALAGADVLATDWSPDAIVFVTRNARRNGLRVRAAVCDWRHAGALVEDGPWDLVLASDVLYEARNADVLLELLPRLADEVLLADPGRPAAAPFLREAARAWRVERGPGGVHRLTAAAAARPVPAGADRPGARAG